MEENFTSLKRTENDITFKAQSKAAKLAGFTYLLTTAIVVISNFTINARLDVKGNAVETARNILAHESLFRLSIVCHLVYCGGIVVLLTALYLILKPVDRILALIAAFWRLLYALAWAFIALNFFTALRLLSGADYLHVFEEDRLQALAKVFLSGFDAYYVGLLFWSLASTICAWLWFKSNYIPRALSAFGVISSIWCVACTLIFLIFPNFSNAVNLWWFDSPMAIFEIATSFWLLFKGIRKPKME